MDAIEPLNLAGMPKPDWISSDGTVALYNDDCLSVLPKLPDGCVDAVVTDPPFFMPADHYQSRVQHGRAWSDTSVLTHWWGQICDAMVRPTKQSAHVATFCNSDSYAAFYPAMFTRWHKLKCLVWDKGHVGLGRIFRNQHELIIWARNGEHWTPDDGVLRADVFTFTATPSTDREHPVEKPAQMLEFLVRAMCPRGGVVCDPFAGSATCGAAAVASERRFIGIEKEPRYFDIAVARIQRAFDDQALFTHDQPKHEQAEMFTEQGGK